MNQQTEQQENWKIFNNIYVRVSIFSQFSRFFHFLFLRRLPIIRSVSSLLWWYSWFANDDHDLQSHSNKIIQPRKFLAEINLSSESLIFSLVEEEKMGKLMSHICFRFFPGGLRCCSYCSPAQTSTQKRAFALVKDNYFVECFFAPSD